VSDLHYLGLVPARGGSKGIPAKNLADLGGKPLVQHTLEAALESSRLSSLVLSSDDQEILALGQRLGFPVLRRPDELAADDAPMLATALHALESTGVSLGREPDALVLLQPTSPFRTASDIDAAVAEFERTGVDTLASAVHVHQHPCDCVRVAGGRLERVVPLPHEGARRQELPKYLYLDGAIYISTSEHLRQRGSFVDGHTAVFLLDRSHGLDINDPFELDLARGLMAVGSYR
jgi:CMP-N,N'-diacetyllegionaminic acid synthase